MFVPDLESIRQTTRDECSTGGRNVIEFRNAYTSFCAKNHDRLKELERLLSGLQSIMWSLTLSRVNRETFFFEKISSRQLHS